jgi:MFS family permease
MTASIKWFLSFRFFTTVAMQMKMTILGYYLYQLTGEAKTLGLLGLYEALPKILTSLPAGFIVEQMEKKKALLIVVSGYLVFFIGLIFSIHFLSDDKDFFIYSVYALVFLIGIIGSLGIGASVALFSSLMTKENMPKYTAISSSSWQIGAIVGTILGAKLLGEIGAEKTMIIASLFLIIAIFSIIQLPKVPVTIVPNFNFKHSISQIKEGLDYVFSNKVMLWAISLDLFAVLFGGCVALLPIFAKEILFVGEDGYGWLRASIYIGSTLTMLIMSRYPIRKDTGKWLIVFVALFGLATIGFAKSENFYLSFIFLFLSGGFDAVSVVIRGAILMMETPDLMRARVSSVNSMFISSSNEIGAFESGFAAQYMGTVRSVVFGGSMTLLFVSIAWLKAKELVKYEFKK